MVCGAHEHGTHVIGLKVHHNGHYSPAAIKEFPGLGVIKAIDANYAVTHLQGLSDLLKLEVGFHIPELAQQDFAYFTWFKRYAHQIILLFL